MDEVDSILVDEARTPLIISGMPQKSVQFYEDIDRIVSRLRGTNSDDKEEQAEFDYFYDEKQNQAALTDKGWERVDKMLGVQNVASDPRYLDIRHHVENSVTVSYTHLDVYKRQGLLGDMGGFIASIIVCNLFFS